MKALKIVAVVLGALLVLTGLGLLVGSAFTGVGQQAFDSELTRQGFGGPVRGTVTEADTEGRSSTSPSSSPTRTATSGPAAGRSPTARPRRRSVTR